MKSYKLDGWLRFQDNLNQVAYFLEPHHLNWDNYMSLSKGIPFEFGVNFISNLEWYSVIQDPIIIMAKFGLN